MLTELEGSNVEVAAFANCANLVDLVWKNKPARTPSKVMLLDQRYTGRSVADKLAEVRDLGCWPIESLHLAIASPRT